MAIIPNLEESEVKPFNISLENKLISAISDYVHQNYYKKLSLTELAENLSLSPSYLSHFIKKHLNRSFSEYMTYVRYVNAKSVIYELNYTLNGISAIVGFLYYRYMNKAFKKHLDMMPNEYLQKISIHPNTYTRQSMDKITNKNEMLRMME